MKDTSRLGTLCFRVDGDSKIGIGHAIRCLALAQEWMSRGGSACFISNSLSQTLCERVGAEGVKVRRISRSLSLSEDAAQTGLIANEHSAAWLVIDGYAFPATYLESIRALKLKILAIDDLGDRDLSSASLVLNQNVYAHESLYPNCSNLLLGTKFSLLRKEFINPKRSPKKQPDFADKVLITLGGADTHNITLATLVWISKYIEHRLKLTVLVGPTNLHIQSLLALDCGRHEVSIKQNPPNVPEIMSQSDVVISAAGSSCWELAHLGIPMLLIVTADNQRLQAPNLRSRGVADLIGDNGRLFSNADLGRLSALLENRALRVSMAERAQELVDGLGSSRVVSILGSDTLPEESWVSAK